MALSTLRSNRLRSLLTMLGIVIGIGLALLGLLFLFSGYQLSKVKATLTSGS